MLQCRCCAVYLVVAVRILWPACVLSRLLYFLFLLLFSRASPFLYSPPPGFSREEYSVPWQEQITRTEGRARMDDGEGLTSSKHVYNEKNRRT